MLHKHHVDYLESGASADVWDERDLPPGPFRRRKLITYYTQGSWIWAQTQKGGKAILLTWYHTWQSGYAHRMGGPADALDVALEICAQVDGMSYAARRELIEAQVEAKLQDKEAARRMLQSPMTDLDF